MLLSAPADKDLDQVYREHRPDLLRYFRRRHGNDALAEDLLHETFAAVLKDPSRVLLADSPRAYLFGIARHISMDAFRRARPAEPLAAEEPAAKAEEQDPRLEAMSLAIAALEPNFRQILQLRLHDELSYDEIAETLRIPVGTVRSRLHHAVKMLSASMRKDPNL